MGLRAEHNRNWVVTEYMERAIARGGAREASGRKAFLIGRGRIGATLERTSFVREPLLVLEEQQQRGEEGERLGFAGEG